MVLKQLELETERIIKGKKLKILSILQGESYGWTQPDQSKEELSSHK